MKVTVHIIEAAKGYIAELSLPKSWTVYSKVYPTKERAVEETNLLCEKSGWKIKETIYDENSVEENEKELP